MIERHLAVGGRQTRLLSSGAGPPILWLHDTRGNDWTQAHALLAERHLVQAPSLPGFEDSSTLDGIDSPEDVVFWLLDLLDALELEPPIVLGCGLGGWMAAELAVRDPERLAGLVLVNAYGLQVHGALPADEFALTPPMLRPLLFADPDGAIAMHAVPDVEPVERLERRPDVRGTLARCAPGDPAARRPLPVPRNTSSIRARGADICCRRRLSYPRSCHVAGRDDESVDHRPACGQPAHGVGAALPARWGAAAGLGAYVLRRRR